MSNLPVVIFLTMSLLLTSCEVFERATPVPGERVAFVGIWKSASGFTIEILASGSANLSHKLSQSHPDFDKLCIKVGPPVITGILVKFKGNDILEVIRPLVYAKEYSIDRVPYQEDDGLKMVLNGVTLMKQ